VISNIEKYANSDILQKSVELSYLDTPCLVGEKEPEDEKEAFVGVRDSL
jgi:hypothetical protein